MVRLSKIYTKVGDAGQTMLGDGNMTPKHHLRVEAYGTVDETNAQLSPSINEADAIPNDNPTARDIRDTLTLIQNDLFDLGADLCVPIKPDEAQGEKLRIIQQQTQWLEQTIDRFNEPLEPLNSFVLPGGTPLATQLHIARTVCRRAERLVAQLIDLEPDATNRNAMIYLNRLSDLLFVLARLANTPSVNGTGDVLWIPGASRNRQTNSPDQ